MLCPAPTFRSNTNWLDRLRSTRGIPTSDAEDLDHFLHGTPPTDPKPTTHAVSAPPSASPAVVPPPQAQGLREVMTSILSDLFEMGVTAREPVMETKRSSRKRPNPRFLPCSQGGVRDSSLDSRWDERGKEGLEESAGFDEVGEEEEGGVGDGMEQAEEEEGLIGYSRSEVTIIDTSCEVWKFEKLVYRRKDVWKVRDRKGKWRGKMRKTKKRKLGGSETDGQGGGKRKVLEFLNEGHNSVEKDERNPQNVMGVERKIEASSSVALIKVTPVKIKKTRALN